MVGRRGARPHALSLGAGGVLRVESAFARGRGPTDVKVNGKYLQQESMKQSKKMQNKNGRAVCVHGDDMQQY